MAKKSKKTYKGVVLEEFKVGYKDVTVTYHVGSTFETENKNSLEHLINIKKIK
jgi:hypothetical protein